MKPKIKLLFILLSSVFLMSFIAIIESPEDEAKAIVTKYMESLKAIADNPGNPNIETNSCEQMKKLVWDGKYENKELGKQSFPIPNDLSEEPNSCGKKELTTYTTKFINLVKVGKINHFEYKINKIEQGFVPEHNKEERSLNCIFVYTTQSTNISKNENKFTWIIETKEIIDITNVNCNSTSIPPPTTTTPGPAFSNNCIIGELHADASHDFTNHNYESAYQKYLSIIEIKEDGDAYYRLAVMTYLGQGCKNLFTNNKARYRKVDEYLEKAQKFGNSEIRRKAINMSNHVNN